VLEHLIHALQALGSVLGTEQWTDETDKMHLHGDSILMEGGRHTKKPNEKVTYVVIKSVKC
jgi:hypothetical protein